MAFKLTPKNIRAIENLVDDYAKGLPMDLISQRHGNSHPATLKGFLARLRALGAAVPARPRATSRPALKARVAELEEMPAKLQAGGAK